MAAPVKGAPPSLSFQLILLMAIICSTYSNPLPEQLTVPDLLKAMAASIKAQQVAFSLGLWGAGDALFLAPDQETPLIFKTVKTNIGNAYNSDTGVFTAPLKGSYMFQWHVIGEYYTRVFLYKNSERTFTAHENQKEDFGAGSQSIILALEAGDTVNLRMAGGSKLHDNSFHFTTFSGYLIFPM